MIYDPILHLPNTDPVTPRRRHWSFSKVPRSCLIKFYLISAVLENLTILLIKPPRFKGGANAEVFDVYVICSFVAFYSACGIEKGIHFVGEINCLWDSWNDRKRRSNYDYDCYQNYGTNFCSHIFYKLKIHKTYIAEYHSKHISE